jgi:uncharacterized membrane protein YoaK (UPF0700 family)
LRVDGTLPSSDRRARCREGISDGGLDMADRAMSSITGIDSAAATANSPAVGRWTMDAKRRARLVLILAVVSGATDASGFLHLGGAFASVMTGNMVLLGLAGGTANSSLAAHAGAAIAAFIVGCVIGGRVAGHHHKDDGIWPTPITIALTVELAIFVVYAIGLEAVNGDPGSSVYKTVLLALNAIALGLQSGAIQRFGIPGLSTTYLTGTLTTTIVHLSTGRPIRHVAFNLQLLVGLIVGAAAGGLIAKNAMSYVPALQIGGVGLVILLATAGARHALRPAR